MTLNNGHKLHELDEFYVLIDDLKNRIGGYKFLSDCSGAMTWPQKGVYFFFEPGEFRKDGSTLRVIRVGTHAVSSGSKSTLWSRLRTHRGRSSGGGNHRGSVFRKLVGLALIGKGEFTGPATKTWGKGNSAPREVRNLEKDVEFKVSNHIGRMPFLWVEIDDDAGPNSERAFIERNAIALLSNINGCSDLPSKDWLGFTCPKKDIQESGLWNSNHVRDEYSLSFLPRFAEFIGNMEIRR
jgi:hypothetical protein